MLHPEVCEAIGVPALGDDFRAPLVSAIPTLLISGTLDANTPVAQAEAHRRRLSRSAHLIVTNAGHESTLPVPEVQQVILDFFSDRMVTDRTIVVPVPNIRPVHRPPGRPGLEGGDR
jgi:pimeloyl-ACP methyl ester carboxylesterase